MIMLQPEIVLNYTESNTGFAATYIQRPIMNIFFMRDQMISTAKGIVIGRMNSAQRQLECDIAEFCLNKIGFPPIYHINGENAYLEGGDFLPFGDYAFIGRGLRTTQEAIDQLMENDLLGCNKVVVVKDVWDEQEQMHLDTYFNIIDRDLCTLSEARYLAAKSDSQYLKIDIWERENENEPYHKAFSDISFVDFLEDELKMKIIPIQRSDELTYANNFLNVAPRKIMAVAGQSMELQDAFKANFVDVTWVPLSNLTKGYGAAHCMTQILDDGDVLF
jgi:arginine deiminase